MALTQEEIRIRAGLDYSKVTAGLTDIRSQIYKLASDVPKKLTGLFRATVIGFGAGLISEVLPTWEEFWNKVYGVGPDADKRLDELVGNLRKLRAKLTEAKSGLDKTRKDIDFKNANDENKAFKLSLEDQQLGKREAKIAASIQNWQDHIKRLKTEMADVPARQEEINKAVVAQKNLEAELADIQSQRLKLQDKVADLFKGIAEKTAQKREQRLRDAVKEKPSDEAAPTPSSEAPPTPPTPTERYLERGKAAGYLAIGQQSAAERYSVGRRMMGLPDISAPNAPRPQPDNPGPAKVVIVGIETK